MPHCVPVFANTCSCEKSSHKQINTTSLCVVSSRDWHSPVFCKLYFSKGARGTWEPETTHLMMCCELRFSERSSPATRRHFRGRLLLFLLQSFLNASSWSANAESRPKRPNVDSAQFLSNTVPHESFPAVCQVKSLKQATFLKQDSWLPQAASWSLNHRCTQ